MCVLKERERPKSHLKKLFPGRDVRHKSWESESLTLENNFKEKTRLQSRRLITTSFYNRNEPSLQSLSLDRLLPALNLCKRKLKKKHYSSLDMKRKLTFLQSKMETVQWVRWKRRRKDRGWRSKFMIFFSFRKLTTRSLVRRRVKWDKVSEDIKRDRRRDSIREKEMEAANTWETSNTPSKTDDHRHVRRWSIL